MSSGEGETWHYEGSRDEHEGDEVVEQTSARHVTEIGPSKQFGRICKRNKYLVTHPHGYTSSPITSQEASPQLGPRSSVAVGERHGRLEKSSAEKEGQKRTETKAEAEECHGWLQRTKKGTEQYSAQPSRVMPVQGQIMALRARLG